MKRFTAALIGCIMITSAFASCSLSKNSSSSSASSSNETSEPESIPEGSVYGTWNIDNSSDITVTTDDMIYMTMTQPVTTMLAFNNDGTGVINGQDLDPGMFDFDGEVYRIHMTSDDDLTLRRNNPNDATEFFGTYTMESGSIFDSIKEGYEKRGAKKGDDTSFDEAGIKVEVDISENSTNLVVYYKIGELTSDNSMHWVIDGEDADITFEINGDTMELTHSNGKTKTATRVN